MDPKADLKNFLVKIDLISNFKVLNPARGSLKDDWTIFLQLAEFS